MRKLALLPLLCCLLTPAAFADDAPATPPPAARDADAPVTVKLGIESGRENDHGRDTRVFNLPCTCGDAKANFTWGCGGQTILTKSFADKARIEIRDNDALKQYVDGAGRPLFVGDAPIDLVFGGQSHQIVALVMRDGEFNKNVPGVIGFDAAKAHQWEIDPRGPQITFRKLGTAPAKKPLATVPLAEQDDNLVIHVKVKGVEDDVALMPQTPEFQASPALQKGWNLDLTAGGEARTNFGNARVLTFRGEDAIQFSDDVKETNFLVYLLSADNPAAARSAMGQSILNRFVYCVDVQRKELSLMERVPAPATAAPSK
jgi:hypothetical protein